MQQGDKLSLKGKIFELQKKLQIIDFKEKRENEFSFRPTIHTFELPNRDSNVIKNITKADLIRKVVYQLSL